MTEAYREDLAYIHDAGFGGMEAARRLKEAKEKGIYKIKSYKM